MSEGNKRTAISIAARENIMCTYGGVRPACLPEDRQERYLSASVGGAVYSIISAINIL